MPKNEAEIGRTALAAALARAGKRASTAAVIAAAIPLSMMAAPPAQAVTACTGTSICGNGSSVTPGAGFFNYNYSFASGSSAAMVHSFQIPEVHAGEFLTGSGGAFLGSIPSGWFVTETTTGTAPFKAPFAGLTPGAFINVTFGGEGQFFGFGSGFNMTLESVNGTNIAATVGGTFAEGGSWEIDPPTPGPIRAPEPASLVLLGSAVAGVAAMRRRRKS